MPGLRVKPFAGWCVPLLVAVLMGSACTDLRVDARHVDVAAPLPAGGGFRFARAALAGVAGTSASARAGDAAARAAIAAELAERGFSRGGEDAALRVDFTLRDGLAANVARLDSPSDYQRSWRAGSAGDGSGSMDHTIADSAFRRELELTVVLIPTASGKAAWEGRVSRSVAPDYPDEALGEVLRGMCRKLFRELE